MTDLVRTTSSHDGAWLRVVMSHPKGNLVTRDMMRDMLVVLDEVERSPALKFLSIEGHGRDFSFGASIDEHAPGLIDEVLPQTHALIRRMLDLPVVTAAMVRGRCLGGGFELALCCDFLFASEDAVFGLPEVGIGVFPPAGSVLLPLRVGQSRAARAVITGQPRPAPEWNAAGLLELVAPAAALAGKMERWFETQLLPRSASALRHTARASRAVLRDLVSRALPEVERQYLGELMSTADAVEGITAFLEKRAPRWKNT